MIEEKLDDTQPSAAGISGVLGALTSKAASYIPSYVPSSAAIFDMAKELCANGGIEGQGPPIDPRVQDLVFGWATDSKTDRQAGQFFRLAVEERHFQTGFILTCRGYRGGKFKLLLFDVDGNLMFKEDGVKQRSINQRATIHFTPFDTYRLDPSTASPTDKQIPEVFRKLESYSCSKRHIKPGKYLLCVYGDNYMGKTHFNLLGVPANDSTDLIAKMTSADKELVDAKIAIDDFKIDFLETKSSYEAALARAKEEETKLDALLKIREAAYKEFLDASEKAYRPQVAATDPDIHSFYPDAPDIDPEAALVDISEQVTPGAGIGPTSPVRRASALLSGAAANATAAGGWLAGRLSAGVGQLRGLVASRSASTDSAANVLSSASQDEAFESTENAFSSFDQADQEFVEEDAILPTSTTNPADLMIDITLADTANVPVEAEDKISPTKLPERSPTGKASPKPVVDK